MNQRAPAVATAAVATLAAVPAIAGLGNGFVYDDVPVILQNSLVHSLSNSGAIWHSSYWPAGRLYRPLTVQLFALEWTVGGGKPLVFHAISLVLAVTVAVLVFRLVRRVLYMTGAPAVLGASLFATALFALHPAHVEVVANLVGQSELLAALFAVLAVERYLTWRAEGEPGATRRLLLAGLTLLAMLSKEIGVVVPLLLGAAELSLLSGRRPRLGALYVLQAAAVAGALLARWSVLGSLVGENPVRALQGLSAGARGVAMLAVVPQWIRLLFWPAHLQAEYGPPALALTTQLSAAHWMGLFVLVLVAVVWLATRRRAPAIGFGLLWTGLALAPVSNLLVATGLVVAERVLFLPSVGLVIGLGAGFALLWPRVQAVRAVAAVVAVSLLVAAGVRSVGRNAAWRSQAAFFDHLLRDAPTTYRAQYVTSRYYFGERRYADAERAARTALALYPDDPRIHEQLGQVLRVEGRCGDALPVLDAGLALEPDGTVLRSRLIECALATGDTARARAVADAGVRRGLSEFRQTLERLSPRPP